MADKRISELAALTTPAAGDLIPIVDVSEADTALKNKALLYSKLMPADGWIPVSSTWKYASATTITVPSGAASIYKVGQGIKLTQTTVKYFYIVAVANTLLTITGGSDYTLTNAAISAISYTNTPGTAIGFPVWFNYEQTLTWSGTAPTTPSKSESYFKIDANACTVNVSYVFTDAGSSITGCTLILPVYAYSIQPANGSITANTAPNLTRCDAYSTNGRLICASVSANRLLFNATYRI